MRTLFDRWHFECVRDKNTRQCWHHAVRGAYVTERIVAEMSVLITVPLIRSERRRQCYSKRAWVERRVVDYYSTR